MPDGTQLLYIELLGGLRLRRAENVIVRFRTRQTAALLAYLAYFPQPHSREELIERFWPNTTIEKGRNNLRVALASLRRQLELPDLPKGTFLVANHRWVKLQQTAAQTDVRAFEAALQRATTNSSENHAHLSTAFSLYKGVLLPGFYDDWIPIEESRLEDLFIEAGKQLIAHCIALGGVEEARQAAHYAARVAPRREEGAFWVEKLKSQSRLVAPVNSPLSLQNARADAVLPSLQANFTTHLPPLLNRFFGRESEIATVELLLHTVETRLITLNGPGGCGKTRLALEIARRHAQSPHSSPNSSSNSSQNPVFFVALADVSEASFMRDAIVNALPPATLRDNSTDSINEEKSDDFQRALNWLKQFSSCLLVLDNLEHLLPMAAEVVQEILFQVPSLCCLVTSRQSLNVTSERIVAVGPLLVPQAGENDIIQLCELPAVRLFIDRAQARRPDFQITPHNATALADLVRRLEGIPIALELCAAQSRVLSPRQILLQIEAEFAADFNAAPTRVGLRHDSVRATFEWSYRLLTPPLQQVLRALSVFRGGFSSEGAGVVCQENLVLPALAFLRDASLLQSTEIVTSPGHSEMRFSMLETVRTFAESLLENNERQIVAARHSAYYLALPEQIKEAPSGSWQGWTGVLEREQDNFWVALQWATDANPTAALRFMPALRDYWLAYQPTRGNKAAAQLAALILGGQLEVSKALQSKVLCQCGELALRAHDFPRARLWLENSLWLSQNAGAERMQASILSALGFLALEEQNLEQAQHYFEKALPVARAHNNAEDIAWILRHQAALLRETGQADAARDCLIEALLLFQEAKDNNGAAWVNLNLSGLSVAEDDWETARQLCDQALAYFRYSGHKTGLMWSLHQRGEIARHFKEENTRQLFEESLALARTLEATAAIELCLQSLESLNSSS